MSKYYITNGTKYLRQNRKGEYYLVNEKDATMWNTYKQALNALNNGIHKDARGAFYVETSGRSSDPKTILNSIIEADTSDFYRWLSSIGNFKRLVNTIDTTKKSLLDELEDVDKEICDILHYVEFSKLNASQGWAASEMIKNSRLRRRKIKDALYIIEEIKNGKKYGVSEDKSAQLAIQNLSTRRYVPRKLEFLFQGSMYVHC